MMPFALPPAETRLPLSALLSGFLPLSNNFSEKFETYLGVDDCVLANSARSILYLLFCTLRGRHHADNAREVLLPGYTCYSVAAAVVKSGLRVALYDMDPHTLQPDFDDVRRKINSRTLAVIGQHLLGIQTDIKGLAEIAHQHDICCIEDSAQSLMPRQINNGSIMAADYVLFSFGRGKPLPLGGGGALIAKEQNTLSLVKKKLRGMPLQSTNRLFPLAVQLLSRPCFYWMLELLPLGLGRTIYDTSFSTAPMSSLHQRIGDRALIRLKRLDRHRGNISRIYCTYFGGNVEKVPSHIRFPLLVANQNQVSTITKLGARRLYPLALCDLPDFVNNLCKVGSESLPGAREIASQLITLPTHLSVDPKIAEMICREVTARFREIHLVR